jgi:hypothetical protein
MRLFPVALILAGILFLRKRETTRMTGSVNIPYELKMKILKIVSSFEGNFDTLNKDGEYLGLFDNPKKDANGNKILPQDRPKYPNYKANGNSRYGGSKPSHVGLSFGFVQFTQRAGGLGNLLKKMHQADPSLFNSIFGGTSCAAELLSTTSKSGEQVKKQDPTSHTGYAYWSPKCEPICGALLWEEPWVSRFKEAGKIPKFQEVQVSSALSTYFDSAIKKIIVPYNIRTEKGMAIAVDRSVQSGPGNGAKSLFDSYYAKTTGTEIERLEKFYLAIKSRSWSHRVRKFLDNPNLKG